MKEEGGFTIMWGASFATGIGIGFVLGLVVGRLVDTLTCILFSEGQ